MTYLRSFLTGLLLATAVCLFVEPTLPIALFIFLVGMVFGVLLMVFDAVMQRLLDRIYP